MRTNGSSFLAVFAAVSLGASCKETAPPVARPVGAPIEVTARPVAQPEAARVSPITESADAGVNLAEKEIIYGVKSGHTVVVFRRDLGAGADKKVLTYEEHKKTSTGNYWETLPPSIAVSHDAASLAFVDRGGPKLLDLKTNRSRHLITKKPHPAPKPDDNAPVWSVRGMDDVYHLASPQWSPNDRFLSFHTAHLEGGGFGLIDIKSGRYQSLVGGSYGATGIIWSPSANALAVVVSGAEEQGLHIALGPDFGKKKNLAATIGKGDLPFHEASFSPAGSRLAVTYSDEEAVQKGASDDTPQARTMAIVGVDGKEFVKVARGFVEAPLFAKDGASVVFVETKDKKKHVMSQSLGTKKSDVVAELPGGFDNWGDAAWTRDGYLLLVGRSLGSDGKAVLTILDLARKKAAYTSPVFSRFTTFAGVF